MRDRLSIQCSTDKKEKDHILEVYKKNSINLAGRVLNFLREDTERIEAQNNDKGGKD